jgi:hypothetical protein
VKSVRPEVEVSPLPYDGIRIIESSETVAGRLAGLLFADQGAEVLIERESGYEPDEPNEYLDRGKVAVPADSLGDTSSADVVIVDGDAKCRSPTSPVLLGARP